MNGRRHSDILYDSNSKWLYRLADTSSIVSMTCSYQSLDPKNPTTEISAFALVLLFNVHDIMSQLCDCRYQDNLSLFLKIPQQLDPFPRIRMTDILHRLQKSRFLRVSFSLRVGGSEFVGKTYEVNLSRSPFPFGKSFLLPVQKSPPSG